MIAIKIDVDLIDKSRFYKGKKARYLDLVLFETKDDKYGNDYLVKQAMTLEERQMHPSKRPDLPILGNAKIIKTKGETGSAKKEDDWI
jgi:hypothetical protein